jgi:serine/threonine protein kinase
MNSVLTRDMLASNCVGTSIDGKFTLLRWLGQSERSSVFLTELEGDPPRKAAIKLIPARAVDADACLAQWAAASDLSHPHLVRLFDCGRCAIDGEEYLYVVTECADEILSEILAARALTPAETAEMLGPVLDALSWLHARDLIHAHLKPSNIMVVNDSLKLSVDGLRTDGEFGRPSLSSGKGDAPEIATGILSPAADLWSLGVLVVEALTLRPPVWNASSDAEPFLPAPMPRPFSSIARGCLQVDPAIRWTLSDIRASLEPTKAAEPARDSTPNPPGRTRTMILAGAVLVLGGTISALVVASHHAEPAPPPVTQTSVPAPAVTENSAPPPTASQPQSSAAQQTAPEPPAPQPVAPAEPQPQASAPPQSVESPGPAATPLQGAVVKGEVVSQATPDVPQHILDTIQGHIRVRIRVQVDSQGKVADAAIDDPGPSRYFAAKALAIRARLEVYPSPDERPRRRQHLDAALPASVQTGTTVAPVETAP